MVSPVVSFRDSRLQKELESRGESLGLTAQRDLDRYYLLLSDALRRVQLAQNEALLLCDALNGCMNDFHIRPDQSLKFSIEDAIDLDRLDKKWEVDKSKILQKLDDLTVLQAASVLDAVERFWYESESYQIEDTEAKLKQVGLIQ